VGGLFAGVALVAATVLAAPGVSSAAPAPISWPIPSPTAGWPAWAQNSPTPPGELTNEVSYQEEYDYATGLLVFVFGSVTWTYDGSAWAQQDNAPGDAYSTMAYDGATGQIVLFGGEGAGSPENETWTYNGSTWTEQHPARSPEPLENASMVYDPASGQMVLFGGLAGDMSDDASPGTGQVVGGTWTYDGQTWTAQAAGPPPRQGALMVYDPTTQEVVLEGGSTTSANVSAPCNGGELGDVWTFDGAGWTEEAQTHAAAVAVGGGYWMAQPDGEVDSCGTNAFPSPLGPSQDGGDVLNQPIVGIASTADGQGYWEVAADGGVFAIGDAGYFGSTGNLRLNQPIVGIAPTPDGGGYWLVAADGGIFAFGDARFHGSTGNLTLNQPIVGMAATPDGGGYWLVAADGGIFAFGDARFYGSTGNLTLNQPIVGMASAAGGAGYWMVGADGGIFSFGDAGYFGSLAGTPADDYPVVGMYPTPDDKGYTVINSLGAPFIFGDAVDFVNPTAS
jgi:Galactose oxidase, central domain